MTKYSPPALEYMSIVPGRGFLMIHLGLVGVSSRLWVGFEQRTHGVREGLRVEFRSWNLKKKTIKIGKLYKNS